MNFAIKRIKKFIFTIDFYKKWCIISLYMQFFYFKNQKKATLKKVCPEDCEKYEKI